MSYRYTLEVLQMLTKGICVMELFRKKTGTLNLK